MLDLDGQLRAYGRELDEVAGRLRAAPTPIQDRPPGGRRRPRRRRVLVAALIAVACLAAIVVGARSDGSHPRIVTPGQSSPSTPGPGPTGLRECVAASQPVILGPGQDADGLPARGVTDLAHVQHVLASDRAIIEGNYRGIVALQVEPRNGDVWSQSEGDTIVERVADYWIVARLARAEDCPGTPAFYDGVPIKFVAPAPVPTPTTSA